MKINNKWIVQLMNIHPINKKKTITRRIIRRRMQNTYFVYFPNVTLQNTYFTKYLFYKILILQNTYFTKLQ